MWRLHGDDRELSLTVSYHFRVTLQVSWHPMWQTSKNMMHMRARACVCVRSPTRC